jgi:hypothetical protein
MFRRAEEDVRYLVNRNYPKKSAVRFVSDHYRLPQEQRYILSRIVVPEELAHSRRLKLQPPQSMRNKNVYIDGYNVLISVEALLAGNKLYLSDDGFLRDSQGIFRKYKVSGLTEKALFEIAEILTFHDPARIEILFDQQIGLSGLMAANVRKILAKFGLNGIARTIKDVDRQLKIVDGIVATSDGNIIDSSRSVVDLPAEIAKKLGLQSLIAF